MTFTRPLAGVFFVSIGLMLSSCEKKVEIQVKEVDKKYSFAEVNSFNGLQRVILSSGSNGQFLYFQQPYSFTKFTNQSLGRKGLTISAGRLPSDVRVRLPIGRDITAYPSDDSTLVIFRNDEPLNYEAFIQLRRFDHNAVRLNTHLFSLSKCMAINKNNFLLAPYDNSQPDRPITFLLAAVTPGRLGTDRVSATLKKVIIPITASMSSGVYVRNIEAIDDYFLVNLNDAGIYKIRQDGSARQVYGYAIVDAFYKWGNTLYAPVEYNEILTSKDEGETWQSSFGTPLHFTLSNYYSVRDSLVGVYFGNLYTVHWNGPLFQTRFLKNDGLGQSEITGVEFLHDTVYVATTSGLFAQPVSTFFTTKQ